MEPRLQKSIGKKVRISIALRIDDDALTEKEGYAFSLIPIEKSLLPFHLDARFPTTVGRQQIREENPLAKWLIESFVDLAKALPDLLWEIGWLKPRSWSALPLDEEAQGIFAVLVDNIRKALAECTYFPGADGDFYSA